MSCVNGLLLDAGSDHMATMIYGVLDTESGELRMVNAGHPPPLLIEAEGPARFLEGRNGPPVGALPTVGYTETCTVLTPGATLLLYTDGLVEERDENLADGLARLAGCFDHVDRPLEVLCDDVLARMVPGEKNDDIALLAARLR
jgi:serine phosphatase RsbU (regulator of sigma subunit)